MIIHYKQFLSLLLCILLILSSVPFAFADEAISYSNDDLSKAVNDKDIRTIISYYLSLTKEYYLIHGLDDNFPYFNALNYIDMYSSSDESIKDNKTALDSYLDHGMLSGNKCGTEFDPYVILLNHPEFILNFDLQMLKNKPEKFIAYLFNLYRDGYSLTPLNEDNKSFTMMLFCSPSDLEDSPGYFCTKNILGAVFGVCGQNDINLTLMLGGTKKWCSAYLNGICCEDEKQYKNGIFSIDKNKLNNVLEYLCSKYDTDISTLLSYAEKVSTEDNPNKAITADIIDNVFNAEVMPFVCYAGNITSGAAITDFINTSKSLYPADNYGFIINGHGAGSIGCSPHEASGSAPDALVTAEAFKSAGVDSEPFTFIAYDSCLMGCTEVAGLLKDYYQYLYASEELTIAGDSNYYSLLNAIKDNINSDDIGRIAVETIFDSYYQGGRACQVTLMTGSAYNSSKVQNVKDTLNNLSTALNTICIYEPDAKIIYSSIKLAAINAFNIGSNKNKLANKDYYDLKDFLIQFKISLDSMKSNMTLEAQNIVNKLISSQGDINMVIEAAENITDSTYATYDRFKIYQKRSGEVQTNITKDIWTRYFGNDFSGSTIFIPYLSNSVSTSDEAKDRLATIKKNYLDIYSGSGCDDYLSLIDGYSKFCLSDSEISRVQRLAKELCYGLSVKDGQSPVKSYRDIASVELINFEQNSTILRVNANDYADGDQVSENSSGNAVIDMMDTVDALRLYITRYMQVKDKKQQEIFIDVIIGQRDISYVEQGYNGFTINADYAVDATIFCAVASDGCHEIINKEDFNNIGNSVVEKLLCVDDTINSVISSIRSDKSKTEEEINNEVSKVLSSYTLVKGQYTLSDSPDKSKGTDVYHVFDNNRQYVFTSERTSVNETDQYNIVNAQSIYFGHKVLNHNLNLKSVEFDNGNQWVNFDCEVCAETDLGYTIESKKFDVKDGISLTGYNITNFTNSNPIYNGYIFANYDYINGLCVLNNKIDQDGNYTAAYIQNTYKSLDELTLRPAEDQQTTNQQPQTLQCINEATDVNEIELLEITTSIIGDETAVSEISENEQIDQFTSKISDEIVQSDEEVSDKGEQKTDSLTEEVSEPDASETELIEQKTIILSEETAEWNDEEVTETVEQKPDTLTEETDELDASETELTKQKVNIVTEEDAQPEILETEEKEQIISITIEEAAA